MTLLQHQLSMFIVSGMNSIHKAWIFMLLAWVKWVQTLELFNMMILIMMAAFKLELIITCYFYWEIIEVVGGDRREAEPLLQQCAMKVNFNGRRRRNTWNPPST